MDLHRHVEQNFAEYVRVFGDNGCTKKFRAFLETGKSLIDHKNYVEGYIFASVLLWHPPSDTILRVHHTKLDRLVYSGGGKLEGNELPIEAAARELEQETGITQARLVADKTYAVPLIVNAHIFPAYAKPGVPAHPVYDLVYLFAVDQIPVIKPDPKEIKNYWWIPVDDPRNVIEHSTTTIREQLTRYKTALPHLFSDITVQ